VDAVRVLITGARAPVALHLARLFHGTGHEVVLADSQRFPLAAATRMKAKYMRLPSPRGNVAAYAEAVAGLGCDLVVSTCEEVFYLAAARDLLGKDFCLFAPSFDVLAAAHDKGRFSQQALGLGADPPRSDVVTSVEELRAIGDVGQRVLKPVWSRFASRVLVKPDAAALDAVVPRVDDPFVVQDFLPGEEICSYGLAWQGRLLGFVAYRPLWRAGLGAGVAFELVEEPAARDFAAGYVARTGWTGQISFDFRRDAKGALHAIECNPRATSGLHFFAPSDGLVEAMLVGSMAKASDRRAMTVPLALLSYGLPQAMKRGEVMQWWRDFRAMGDVLAFAGDRGFAGAQVMALAEIAVVALRQGKSLQQAATDDIEWNGERLGVHVDRSMAPRTPPSFPPHHGEGGAEL